MTKSEEEKYIKEAYQALIDRGVITEDMLIPSNVSDEMLDKFENKYDVKLPSIFRTYLKTYCHNIGMLCAAVPEDMYEEDFVYMEKLQKGEADIDDEPSVSHCWSGIMAVPKEDPLHFLCESIEGFRECTDYIENNVATPEKMKDFVVFGDWMGAGALCFDLKVNEEDVKTDNSDTWQVCWFDHEEFDWEEIEYVDSEGNITGDKIFPSFKAFIDM